MARTKASSNSRPAVAWWAMRVTLAGWMYFGLTLFVLLAAVNSGVNLLYFLFGLFVGAWLVAAIFSWINLRGVSLERDFPDHAVAGEPAEIRYRFKNARRRFPVFGIFFREIHPGLSESPAGFAEHLPATRNAGAEPAIITARLTAKTRGVLTLNTVEISTAFPFGFLRRRGRIDLPQNLLVYPRIGVLARPLALQYRETLESGSVLARKRGGQEEFFGIREYRPGDNLRAIHWRSSARTGRVMVREPASSTPPQLMVILNLRNWRDMPAGAPMAERAIELAAAIVCWGFYENFAVGLAIAGLADEPPAAPHRGWEARSALLERLARANLESMSSAGAELNGRIAGRAKMVVVTLRASDVVADLIPQAALAAAPAMHGPGMPGNVRTGASVLAMDAPGAGEWVRFLDPRETIRLLRQRGTGA